MATFLLSALCRLGTPLGLAESATLLALAAGLAVLGVVS